MKIDQIQMTLIPTRFAGHNVLRVTVRTYGEDASLEIALPDTDIETRLEQYFNLLRDKTLEMLKTSEQKAPAVTP